ncbi:TonB-dependent receptor plug domain-containing protein [Rhodanobacter glycinis]|uniref:Iron complex outermembrane recepter protein n=1 Tax=Rhodanobacter glycinis TaxID=582702 RepID=A0A1I4BID6_9GAMM|nr:TonB-dependent receptor [Rhodanobacter glycinis]SFK68652.1 iron complex outermembrane recepter protein [Rhodanobacter glycinis]
MKQKTLLATAITAALMLQAWAVSAQDASPAPAQTTDSSAPSAAKAKKLETITVTGSRIRSVDVETAQPIVSMSRKQIEATGLTNVSDVLQRIVSANTPDITPEDTLSSGSSVGGTYTSLRNLGSQRTLVLVNGRRWSTDINGLTDLSTIPTSIIERIEILKDGASSIYGSDAIGGVVNIITRDHYNGAEANVYYGQNQKGDGQQQAYDITFGTSTDKSNTVFTASYRNEDAIWDSKRELTRTGYGPRHPEDGFYTGPWGRVVDPTDSSKSYVINHGATDSSNLANYHLYDPNSNADKYNTNQDMTYRAPSRLKNLFAQERYNLTDNITLHATGSYSERTSSSQLAGYPFQTNGNQIVKISGQNAYNPFPGQDVSFFRRTVEMPRITNSTAKLSHFDVGAEGFFGLGDQEWSWDANYSYSKADINQRTTGNINLVNAAKALGPTAMVDGQVVCANADDRAAGCLPWNILAGPGGTSQAVMNYVNTVEQASAQNTTRDFTANVSGGLFDLPAGTVNLAVGVEHRRLAGSFTPDQFASSGYSTDLASAPTVGKYTTNEAYAELDVPLLQGLPGAQELAVNIASRYSHYSNFGSTTNNKYSFRWKPINDLLVRGTYAEGFRAPTLSDLYGGTGQSFETFLDPCDSAYGAASTNPSVAQACSAAGVPANYRQVDASGKQIANNQGGQTPTPFLSGSNAELKPETSTTRTLGLVYSPHFVQGLDFSLDYYNIRIKNTIQSVLASDILNYCYIQNDPSFCGRFTRNSSGVITNLNESLANLGELKTEGYDFSAHYRLPQMTAGQFVVSLDSTYLSKYDITNGPGQPTEGQAGMVAGTNGLFRIRANASLDWSYGNFGATWTVRYYSGLRDNCWDVGVECNEPNYTNPWIGTTGASSKGAVAFNDAQFRYKLPWNASFSVGVNNIFNKKGPFYYAVTNAGQGEGPYLPSFDIDRYFYVSYNQKF